VTPIMNVEKGNNMNIILAQTIQKGVQRGFIDKDKTYILTAGYPTGVAGNTNFIRIMKKDQIEYYIDLMV